MRWAAFVAVVLGAAAPPEPAVPPDPELEMLKTSLAPAQRAAVDKDVGGLGRLPRYRLDLQLDPEAKTLKGREQIALLLAEPTRELWLRLPANAAYNEKEGVPPVAIRRAAIGGKEVPLEKRDPGVYRVDLAEPLPAGQALLEVDLAAELPDLEGAPQDAATGMLAQAMAMLGGGGGAEERGDCGTFGAAGATFNLAGFALELARREAGVFDTSEEVGVGEPRWGALGNWVVSLVAPAGLTVAGTGVEVGATPEADGRKRWTRAAAAVRGFALVAGEGFQEQKATAGEVRVRVLASPAHALQAKKLLHTATEALKFFAGKLGPYPWAQLDLVEAPLTDSTEVVAFPTLLMVSPLLTEPGMAAMPGMGDPAVLVDSVLELATAHQVAHQWWRGVVGSDGLARPALDEPVAAFAAYLYVEQRRGRAQSEKMMQEQMKRAYQLFRTLGHEDVMVDRPLADYSGRLEIEAILRGKGGFYFQKLRKLVGDKAFFTALRQSVAGKRFKDVDSDPVLIAVAGAAPGQAETALKLHDRFMRQTKGDEDIGTNLDVSTLAPGMPADPQSAQMIQQMLKAFGAMGGAGPMPSPGGPQAPPPPSDPKEDCMLVGGTWKQFGDGCVDSCEKARAKKPVPCTKALKWGCDCGPDKCWTGTTCEPN